MDEQKIRNDFTKLESHLCGNFFLNLFIYLFGNGVLSGHNYNVRILV